MKLNLSLTIALLPFIMNSQDLESKIRDSYCECLTEAFAETIIDFSCAESILNDNEDEINQFFLKKALEEGLIDSLNPYQVGFEMGYNYITSIFDKNQQYFFKNCGNYYTRIVEAREIGFSNLFPECEEGTIEKLTLYINQYEHNFSFIYDRGKCYFQSKQYNLALRDFNDSLIVFPDDIPSLFGKAYTLEKLNKLLEASEVYKKLIEMTEHDLYKISYAISKYKVANKK